MNGLTRRQKAVREQMLRDVEAFRNEVLEAKPGAMLRAGDVYEVYVIWKLLQEPVETPLSQRAFGMGWRARYPDCVHYPVERVFSVRRAAIARRTPTRVKYMHIQWRPDCPFVGAYTSERAL